MNPGCEKEIGNEAHFGFGPVRVAPLHLVANPFPGREHEYEAPQAAWLKLDHVVRVVDDARPCGFARHDRDVSPAELQRAADFLWALNCEFEKVQHSVLQFRKPFPPQLARYLLRFGHNGNSRQKKTEMPLRVSDSIG